MPLLIAIPSSVYAALAGAAFPRGGLTTTLIGRLFHKGYTIQEARLKTNVQALYRELGK